MLYTVLDHHAYTERDEVAAMIAEAIRVNNREQHEREMRVEVLRAFSAAYRTERELGDDPKLIKLVDALKAFLLDRENEEAE
jgi:hypothetical protein